MERIKVTTKAQLDELYKDWSLTIEGLSPDEKNLKEQIYDRINIPIWLLDIFIAVCVIALAFILLFKRTK